MIEVETLVYNMVKDYIETNLLESISMSTDSSNIPASFPHISVVEGDSINFTNTIDTGSNENHVVSMIDITIYTDDETGRKTHAKEIAKVVDDIMLFKGFNRISVVQDDSNERLYRYIARYQGIVDKDFNVYRR